MPGWSHLVDRLRLLQFTHRQCVPWNTMAQIAARRSVYGVDPDETHALGYERVDDDPNVSILLGTMEGTGRWEATLRLRAWERKRLILHGREFR